MQKIVIAFLLRLRYNEIMVNSNLTEETIMPSICGVECCNECNRKKDCGGCIKTDGHPFGGTCIATECIKQGGFEAFNKMKKTLIEEFNALGIQGLKINDLNLLNGFFINLEYSLPNGHSVKLLDDHRVYFIKLKSPVKTDAMALPQMISTCLFANMDAMVQSRR